MKKCCWKNLEEAKRIGRASYVCPECGEDVSFALINYELMKRNEEKL